MSLDRPRLRPLDLFPAELEGEEVICLRDPSGLTDRMAFLPRPAAFLAVLCDGTRTLAEVAAEFSARTGLTVNEAQVRRLVEQLDEGLLLDSPRFHAHHQGIRDAFRAAPRRDPAHAGASYPAEADALTVVLRRMADGAPNHARQAPTVLIAPHIDFPRGGAVYGHAYNRLPPDEPPELVVVFGTDHNGVEHPFTLTRKSYETPLGPVATDVALVDELARAGGEALFSDELHHKHEHSIEFQAVWLRHVYGARTPPILPVLCGSLHAFVERRGSPAADPRVGGFLDELARLTAGRRVLAIAGADLAHVGPRFGDDAYGQAERDRLKQADDAALAACAAGDAEGFFRAVADERDRFRVCGLSPIYAALSYRGGGAGKVLAYDQCPADGDGTSLVSIAAVAVGGS